LVHFDRRCQPRPQPAVGCGPGPQCKGAGGWLETRPEAWRRAIRCGVPDLSETYRKTFDDTLAHVVQVADPFHLVKLANSKLDECRRRVHNETIGHRGRKDDPLYRARRLLTKAHERLDEPGDTRLRGLLEAGDPHGEVRTAWHAKQVVRSLHDITDPELADDFVAQLGVDLQDQSCPPEVRSLGRTIVRWHDQIVAWPPGVREQRPDRGRQQLIKRIKRIGFGFRASRTTGSECCSTPAARTGRYSRPSLPAEIR
jgi:transposase